MRGGMVADALEAARAAIWPGLRCLMELEAATTLEDTEPLVAQQQSID